MLHLLHCKEVYAVLILHFLPEVISKHLQSLFLFQLIQFLVTMVQSSRNVGIGIKRHYPLMLNDTSHRPSKISQLSAELSNLNSTRVSLFE